MTKARRTGALLLIAAVGRLAGAFPAAADGPMPTTPIEHFIVLMQENHSFDNYFGTYPGADGISPDTCMPNDPGDPSAGCVKPYHIGDEGVTDLPHGTETFEGQFNGGAMDGFVSAVGGPSAAQAMGYYDDRDIPYYWNIADQFVLFDRFFSSVGGGSLSNHTYWVTGSPGNFESPERVPEGGWGDLPTIFDRLDQAGVSWKFYVQNYDPTINFRNPGEGHRRSQTIWVPLLNYARYLDDPALSSHIVDLEQYFVDLEHGTLPSVAYIVPSGASEHPPGSLEAGQRFVRNLLTSLMKSDYWWKSAFLWSYDDWGGWYDHVSPPRVDAYGYGFRVPALLVSPYARKGYIDNTQMDFTSLLKFIQVNWNLAPLADRDAQAQTFMDAFDFSEDPRPPVLVSAVREAPSAPGSYRALVHLTYGAAILAAVGFLASRSPARLGRRRPRAPRDESR